MDAKFSPRVKDVITYSREEALRLGHNYIGVEHLLLGIIREGEGTAHPHSGRTQRRPAAPAEDGRGQHISHHCSSGQSREHPPVKQAEKILKITYLEAKTFKSPVIGTEHLLLSILKDENNVATKALLALNVDYDEAKQEFESILSDGGESTGPRAEFPGMADDEDEPRGGSGGSGRGTGTKSDSKSKTPVLDNFGRDLTSWRKKANWTPSSDEKKKSKGSAKCWRVARRTTPILIGEPGVGKSAIAEGLAIRNVEKKVSRVLFGKRVVTLDVASLVAGTKVPRTVRGAHEGRHERARKEP